MRRRLLAPAAPVVVTGAVDGDGYRIQVTDRGLGMKGKELAWANQHLAGDAAPGLTGQDGDDRPGLLIVAQLGHGHGFAVRLDPSPRAASPPPCAFPRRSSRPAPQPPSGRADHRRHRDRRRAAARPRAG